MSHTFTLEQIQEMMDESGGFCIACGAPSWDSVEPDARNYPCEECGERKVYGAEELVLMGLVT